MNPRYKKEYGHPGIKQLFRNGFEGLAETMEKNSGIVSVSLTSWLVATNTYGDMMKQFGFIPKEVPEHIIQKHYPDETREIKGVIMQRKKFLEKFSKKTVENQKNADQTEK